MFSCIYLQVLSIQIEILMVCRGLDVLKMLLFIHSLVNCNYIFQLMHFILHFFSVLVWPNFCELYVYFSVLPQL